MKHLTGLDVPHEVWTLELGPWDPWRTMGSNRWSFFEEDESDVPENLSRRLLPSGNGSKPCSPGEHQNRWQMDVHPLINYIYRY